MKCISCSKMDKCEGTLRAHAHQKQWSYPVPLFSEQEVVRQTTALPCCCVESNCVEMSVMTFQQSSVKRKVNSAMLGDLYISTVSPSSAHMSTCATSSVCQCKWVLNENSVLNYHKIQRYRQNQMHFSSKEAKYLTVVLILL